jgi:hypothetical protein
MLLVWEYKSTRTDRRRGNPSFSGFNIQPGTTHILLYERDNSPAIEELMAW